MSELETASRDELLALIAAQQTTIAQLQATVRALEQRVRELETGSGASRRMPGHKPEQAEPRPRRPRRKRSENHARRRSEPTARVVHALVHCPRCGSPLAGGAVKRSREVIELTPVPAVITEHVYLERCCPGCGQRWTPRVELQGSVVGQSRLGIGLVSLIATLREEARLPLAAIQTYLASVHGLQLSVGGIVGALEQVARVGAPSRQQALAAIRASPVIYADETGWREAGLNRFLWTFATPETCYYTFGGRGKAVLDETLGIDTPAEAVGVLVSDFYAAYDHYPGPQQKCWVHLLRHIHELVRQHPADLAVVAWAAAVRAVYAQALTGQHQSKAEREHVARQLQAELAALCREAATDEQAAQAVLCRRILKYLSSLFVFVRDPAVAADNNLAERSLRHSVISRKISGGTRSAQGTQTKLTLATLFGTWRAQGRNPYLACYNLLASPQA
jgi:transposase